MYIRLSNPLLSNSFFVFGARGVGKSSLIHTLFDDKTNIRWIDLLDDSEARRFILNPKLLETETAFGLKNEDWIIIDEIQKVPSLLDYVHRLIETTKINFVLTGSSARKLKRTHANLLAGRAFVNHLHPLTSVELKNDFSLIHVLSWGSLPKIFSFRENIEKEEFLIAYTNTYIKEEIKEEQLIRNISPFLKFLEVAAQCNGQILNYSKIARDSGTDSQSIERYYEILCDTLLGFYLEPYHRSVRKRQSKQSKFYFFDLGVKRALENTLSVELQPRSKPFGNAFEHFFIAECIRLNDYYRTRFKFSYLHTKDHLEIDLIIERPGESKVLIEIKSSADVDEVKINRLKNLVADLGPCQLWIASQVEKPRQGEFYEILPWVIALERLFPG